MAMGLICPLEHVFLLKFVRSREGQGPVFSFGTGIAPGRRENNGPILSFGNMIAPGGHEGLEASFVLWKQIASVSLEAMRGMGPHLSFGNRIASGGREGHGPVFSFGRRIPPRVHKGRKGPWGLICPSETAFRLSVWRPRGAWVLICPLETISVCQSGGHEGHGSHLSFGNSIQSGCRERPRGAWVLICPLETYSVCQPGGHEGLGASFLLWKQHSVSQSGGREGPRGAMGPHLSFGNVLRLDAARGNRVPVAGTLLQGLWACFVLWKQDCVWRPRWAVRSVLSIGTLFRLMENRVPVAGTLLRGIMAPCTPMLLQAYWLAHLSR
jgi:hypothetical protein